MPTGIPQDVFGSFASAPAPSRRVGNGGSGLLDSRNSHKKPERIPNNQDLLLDIFGTSSNSPDSPSGSSVSSPASHTFSILQPLSPSTAQTSFSPTSISAHITPRTAPQPQTNARSEPDDFDDFGDFVDSRSPPPLPPKPLDYKSPVNNKPRTTQNDLLVPVSSMGVQKPTTPVQPKQGEYKIQAQINELGTAKDPIRFGQHMAMPTNGGLQSGNIVTAKWDDIISSRPGPSVNKVRTSSPSTNNLFPASPVKATPANRVADLAPVLHPRSPNSLFKKSTGGNPKREEEWESFNDEPISAEDISGTSKVVVPKEYQGIPDSTELLGLFNASIFSLVDHLFKELIPLSYALKKRVLNNAKTKQFLAGYLETVQIGAQIMAGRYRRTTDSKPATIEASDRAAREFARTWAQEIMPRLRTALPPGSKFQLSEMSTTALSSKSAKGPYCIICGLAKAEHVQKPPVKQTTSSKKWNEENNLGHEKCLKFWTHRSAYGW